MSEKAQREDGGFAGDSLDRLGEGATSKKGFYKGTHRLVTPDETLARVVPHLADMGITRVANVTGLDRIGIPVTNVIRPNARSLSVSQGKGITLEAAKASGIMEAIEGYHAENVHLPTKTLNYDDLTDRHDVIDIDGLARLAGTEFDRRRPSPWIEAINLLDGVPIWLPFELVHTNYTLPAVPTAGCFVASTNGLASGNRKVEAIAHGIAEVVERDATTLWFQRPHREKWETRIDLDSVNDPLCRSLIDRLLDSDFDIGAWNVTSDVGVASAFCLIADTRFPNGHSGAGAGTHPTKEVALLRALTEAVQVRTNYITGARDDLAWHEYSQAGIADKQTFARSLLDGPMEYAIDFDSIPSQTFGDMQEDVDWMLDRLRAIGVHQVACVDLTRSEFQIDVVRIVIPGLEGPHDHDDYMPGPRARKLTSKLP